MVKKNKVVASSLQELDGKVISLKLDLAKQKGMLASKTKTSNTSKKKQIRKQIARLLTAKNIMLKKKTMEGRK